MGFIDLFRPNWKHSNVWKRKNAVKKLTDQGILTLIAKTDAVLSVRQTAVTKITDQTILTELAKTGNDPNTRLVAARRLNDTILAQSIFYEIAKSKADCSIRLAAADQLSDQVLAQIVYAEIAGNSSEYDSYREHAAKALSDEALRRSILFEIEAKRREELMRVADKGSCYNCGQRLLQDNPFAGIYGAASLVQNVIYECKWCGGAYCLNCISDRKRFYEGVCKRCGEKVGW